MWPKLLDISKFRSATQSLWAGSDLVTNVIKMLQTLISVQNVSNVTRIDSSHKKLLISVTIRVQELRHAADNCCTLP